MAKFYAVKEGKKPGIYMSWDECKEQVNGYSGAVYKSFTSEDEAKAFIGKEVKKVSDDLTLLAYVDGSYNIKTKEYGYGCVLIEGQQVIQQLLGKGNIPEYSSMRNVSGEILGCMNAIQYAIDHHYPSICIYYDYEGIEKWATGLWKANKEQTQNYVKTINDMKKKIDLFAELFLPEDGEGGFSLSSLADISNLGSSNNIKLLGSLLRGDNLESDEDNDEIEEYDEEYNEDDYQYGEYYEEYENGYNKNRYD